MLAALSSLRLPSSYCIMREPIPENKFCCAELSPAVTMVIVCSKCGNQNPPGLPVCAKCAAPLANLCPNCNFENPKGFKFCGNCGANLLTTALLHGSDAETLRRLQGYIPVQLVDKILRVGKQIEGERRTVTVLFSDIVGFTSISEQLDPEQVYNIIDSCVAAFRDEIYKHEGTLDKFMGDGVMALFGAPVAHEDDAFRAVRCALGMQESIRRISQDLVAPHGVQLQVRIGLNTGTVIVGDIQTDLKMNYTALGDTVNVAARLQSLAEPGSILASRAVYEQTRALFDFKEEGAIRVKGRVEPVEMYILQGTLGAPSRVRGIPGLVAPMVGRAKELAVVKGIADDLAARRNGAFLFVSGDPGLGKSRLIAELKEFLGQLGIRPCEAGCAAYGRSAYHLVVRLLESCLNTRGEDAEETKREKIEEGVRQVIPSDESLADILPYIENLLGVPVIEKQMGDRIRHLEPSQLRQQTFLAVRDFLAAMAARKPLFVILEDLHWVDKMSLDLLFFLLSAVESAPFTLLCTSRPTENRIAEQVERVGAASLGDKFIHISLEPLSIGESTSLVDLLLTASDLAPWLRDMIAERAQGNPFFLEEIIRMLIDRQVISRIDGRWEIAPGADPKDLQVPITLEGLILTRVDSLPETTRLVLQHAAVIGREFTRSLLTRTMDSADHQLEAALQELLDHELLLARGEQPDRQYEFRHILTQLTVYNSLLMRRRQGVHHRVGEAIEELYSSHLDDQVERLAFHYTQSRDAARALPYLIRSAERASARFANEQALEYLGTAQGMAEQTDATAEQRIRIFSGLGDAQSFVGAYDKSVMSLRAALDLARAVPQSAEEARRIAGISRRLGRLYDRLGDKTEALRWLDSALKDIKQDPENDHTAERARIYLDIGWLYYRQGKLEEAFQWDMRALEICDATDFYAEMGSAYNRLAALFIDKFEWDRATEFAQKGLKYREMIGDIEGMARSHSNLGVISADLCEWDKAILHFERSLEIRRRIGQANGLCNAYTNLGRIYVLRGETAQAREYLRAARTLAERIHDLDQTCLALNVMAEAELVDENWPAAIPLLEASLHTAAEIGSRDHTSQASQLMAEARFQSGDLTGAVELARRAIEIAQEMGSLQTKASAFRVLGAAECAGQNWTEAETHLSQSIGIFDELKNEFEAARSELELALLYRDRGTDLDSRALLERCRDRFSRLGVKAYVRRTEEAFA